MKELASALLEDASLRLEPLEEVHREPLRRACARDQEIWRSLYAVNLSGPDFDRRFEDLRAERGAGRAAPFAVRAEGRIVGLTAFLALDPPNSALEIGSTYYAPEVRGGRVNPACKRLMMGAAFAAGARRVVFRVDALNLRSQAAVLKLGAVREGVLRRDRVTWTGRIRDTVIFSVLDDEWPAVKARLDLRLEIPAGAS